MKKILLWLIVTGVLFAEYNHTNSLINEDSPYLQQHAHNPVQWYPWGKAPLRKAKRENKLIFLSIGYSTCHWCHEMEKESFTDTEVANLLNKYFISIKVDKEEYPQLDKKYQKVFFQKYGKRGGWPLTVFLSPEGKVFHIATYIPKEEGYGSEGLMKMLGKFAKLQRDQEHFAKRIEIYEQLQRKGGNSSSLTGVRVDRTIQKALKEVSQSYDSANGGFAFRPKYPEASKIGMLMMIYHLNGIPEAMHMAKETLKKMAFSGLYDQVEGGFFRYATDKAWQQPHFEKMLYTNAELIPVYVKMYLITGERLYRRVAEETIAQIYGHFFKEGLFLSASDADSNGEEGGYYIYDYGKIREALLQKGWREEEVEANLAYFGIEEDGNFDGELSHAHITKKKRPKEAERLKRYLKQLRKKRRFPFVDKKIMTSWNAMMAKALFTAGNIDTAYTIMGEKALAKLVETMRRKGILYHQVLPGKKPQKKALLEDYAFLIAALVEGYEHTYTDAYLTLADVLAGEALQKFYRNSRWYLSCDGIETKADFDDRYYTSALSTMLESLLKLGALLEKRTYIQIVEKSIKTAGGILHTHPSEAPKLLEVYTRLKKGDVVIHARRKVLLPVQKQLSRVNYPFILSKSQDNDGYIACGIGRCFAAEHNLTKLLGKIETIKAHKGVSAWQKK